jgi:hypothetical protein
LSAWGPLAQSTRFRWRQAPPAPAKKSFVVIRDQIFEMPIATWREIAVTEADQLTLPADQFAELRKKLAETRGVSKLTPSWSDEITRSGVPCYFSVGRDVPLEKGKPETIFEGNSLNVTPTVNADGNIGMQIELSVRTRLRNDLKSASMPSFRTVEVNTNVSIPSGSTLVLGDGDRKRTGKTTILLLSATTIDEPAREKAKRLILPEVRLQGAGVEGTLEYLREQARQADPDGTGVNLVLASGVSTEAQSRKVTLALSKVSLWEALSEVAKIADGGFSGTPDVIVFTPAEKIAPPASPLLTRNFKIGRALVEKLGLGFPMTALANHGIDFLPAHPPSFHEVAID